MNQEASPVSRAARFESLDTLRGVAVLGILLMNICGAGLAFGYLDPSILGGDTGANLVAWIIANLFFEGSMRGIFSILFGAGVVLLTSRLGTREPAAELARIYYRRTFWLIVFGLVNAYGLVFAGDILYAYGIVGVLLFPLRRLPARMLIVLGLATLALLTYKSGVLDYRHTLDSRSAAETAIAAQSTGERISAEEQAAIDAWRQIESGAKPSPATIEEMTADMRGDWLSALNASLPDIIYFQTAGFIPDGFLDALGMMLLGMGLLKLGVLTAQASTRFYVLTLVLGYTVGLAINAWEVTWIMNRNFDFMAFERTSITYAAGRLAMAAGHIALVMLVVRAGALRSLRVRLAAVGQMALTNYLAQSAIQLYVFTGVGLGLFAALERAELYYVVAIVWALQLFWSPLWLARFRFGPAEWLWRSLTYWSPQPMRRAAAQPA